MNVDDDGHVLLTADLEDTSPKRVAMNTDSLDRYSERVQRLLKVHEVMSIGNKALKDNICLAQKQL